MSDCGSGKREGYVSGGEKSTTAGCSGPLQGAVSPASLVAQLVKNPPAKQENPVSFLGREDPLVEGVATHSSILIWRIPMDRGGWWAVAHGVTKSRT